MLARPFRLVRQRDFLQLKKSGRWCRSGYFRICCQPNQLPNSRFAVVVSTRVSKKATERNRLRRQISEIIRLNMPKISGSRDFLIIVDLAALGIKQAVLARDLLAILRKNKLLV